MNRLLLTRLKYFSSFGVSVNSTVNDDSRLYRARIALASATVEESRIVGPEATNAISFPGTSDTMSEITSAGYAAAASHPPRACEICLRTILISCIGAPRFVSSENRALSSRHVIGASWRQRRVEPPP